MATITANYEAVMIFSVKNGEEATQALITKFQDIIAQNGTINNVDDWGKRRLAYEIDDQVEGHYILVDFTSPAAFPAELDRVLGITDGVIRSLITCKVIPTKKAEPAPAPAPAPAATEAAAE